MIIACLSGWLISENKKKGVSLTPPRSGGMKVFSLLMFWIPLPVKTCPCFDGRTFLIRLYCMSCATNRLYIVSYLYYRIIFSFYLVQEMRNIVTGKAKNVASGPYNL